ncbi:MAG: ABC transporter permease [Planctomycetota bacterium]
MRNLIPFDFADLGPTECAWLLLAFGGLSVLAARERRGRAAAIVGGLMALGGIVRMLTIEAAPAWNWWVGPVLVAPLLGAGVVLLRRARRRLVVLAGGTWPLAGIWTGALVLVSLAAQPFDLDPLANAGEWLFLAFMGVTLASLVQRGGTLRTFLVSRGRMWWGALAFLLLCYVARPFGVTWVGGLFLAIVAWLIHAVAEQGAEMRRYVRRRLVGAPFTLLVLLVLSFVMMRLAPGGPFAKDKRVDPEVLKVLEAQYGYDRPLHVQFGRYMGKLLWHGDLGVSTKQKGRTVNEIIAHHAGASARLGLAAIVLALLIGLTSGLISGMRQNSIFDYASMTGAMIGLALPTFVVGPMLVLLFAMKLDCLRVSGWEDFPRDLILPAVTLSLPFAARIARLTRAGMLEIVNQDYIRTARAKGLSEPVIVLRHTLKGTLLPVISFLGPAIALLLTGSLVVETIFNVPGLGTEFVQSALNRDYSLAMGLVVMFGTLLVLFNLVVDIAYAFLDPRIRHA